MVRGTWELRFTENGKKEKPSIQVADQLAPKLTYDPSKEQGPLVFGHSDDEEVEG